MDQIAKIKNLEREMSTFNKVKVKLCTIRKSCNYAGKLEKVQNKILLALRVAGKYVGNFFVDYKQESYLSYVSH